MKRGGGDLQEELLASRQQGFLNHHTRYLDL
jgi:hypothetical protein